MFYVYVTKINNTEMISFSQNVYAIHSGWMLRLLPLFTFTTLVTFCKQKIKTPLFLRASINFFHYNISPMDSASESFSVLQQQP